MSRGKILRDKMAESGLVFAMSAHSPLSMLLAEEAGFDAVWASGFELSALYGLPDVSLVTMTQHLDMTRAMIEQSPARRLTLAKNKRRSQADRRELLVVT